jgi:two-component system, sensor histidine kinase
MKKTARPTKLRNVSIAKTLYFIVGTMAVLIIIELLTLWFAIHTLSSVRSFIAAEGLWSKAQKNGVLHLTKYQRSHDEKDYQEFRESMKVPLGDHKARVELFKKDPDLDTVRQGFLEGRIHPDDIDGMIKLVQRFHNVHYINKAINYWGQGDSLIAVLIPISEEMHRQISSGSPSHAKLDSLAVQIDDINEQLTLLEDNFSFTLEEGSRWLENLLLKILFTVALTVEITGLVLTVLVTRNITRALNEINRAAEKITKGHLSERVTVFANDEIGQVAKSVNRMTEQLVISNQELENFAYIASHDLQEPLRKIMMFTDLLKHEIQDTTSEKAREHMRKITESVSRMQRLIGDVLKFASVGSAIEFTRIDLNRVITGILSEMEVTISTAKAKVIVDPIPALEVNVTEMEQLFQNLISNSLKFSQTDPVINIYAETLTKDELPADYRFTIENKLTVSRKEKNGDEKFCRISIKDNGIGFDEIYRERIFNAFQRLHAKHAYEGTGIGLAICQKIVENHHGTISAESKQGEGSKFIIILPFSQKPYQDI